MTAEAVKYVALAPPISVDPEVLKTIQYLQQELDRISLAINTLSDGFIVLQNSEPDKPRAGMIRYADGNGWRPSGSATGSASGIFFFNGASWVRMDNR